MAEQVPSILLYGQALAMIKDLQTKYADGTSTTVDEVSGDLRRVLNTFQSGAGKPLLKHEPVEEFEPPISNKMNRFWDLLVKDISLLQNQLDVLRASSIFTHNLIKTETLKSAQANAEVNNKLKTLQLFSSSTSANIIVYGDSFHSNSFIDNTLLPSDSLASIEDGVLTLGHSSELKSFNSVVSTNVLAESNGFAGNNQQIEDPATAPISPVTNLPTYRFQGQTNRAAKLSAILDGDPTTWYEYEHCVVSPQDKARANDLNFTYKTTSASGVVSQVDWSNAPSFNKLALALQFSLPQPETINYFAYTPFGLNNNVNYPVVVKTLIVSSNGTDWSTISPQDVWIGTEANLRTASTADQVTIGTAIWNFNAQAIQYIRVLIEQQNSITVPIGHIYYTDSVTGSRIEGPIPPDTDPTIYYSDDPSFASVGTTNYSGKTYPRREYFTGQRYVIAVKDIAIKQVQYATSSTMVSTPFKVGGVVDRVTLDADISVPDSYPKNQTWVNFYVSPDDGSSWYRISRIEDTVLGIPEEIAFNDPLPDSFHEKGVKYIKVPNTVNSIRVKIVLTRPTTELSSTPVVHSYKLKVSKR